MIYTHSPKVIVIAGPPAAGKTTIAHTICEKYDYHFLGLDGINSQVASALNLEISDLKNPKVEIIKEFKKIFTHILRNNRYKNLVLEGCRISHAHIFNSFRDILFNIYGEYTILNCFYINPSIETRNKQYILRKAQLAKKAIRENDKQSLKLLNQENRKGFCSHLEPALPEFEIVDNASIILNSAHLTQNYKHQNLPQKYENLIKSIAETGSYNPFYQRVEVNGETVIHGYTQSESTWKNILKLGIEFEGKNVCDIGCMHGYFTFKLEECGATAHGIDIDKKAIRAAELIADSRKSSAYFYAYDVMQSLETFYDTILALNVLHRVSNFEIVCKNIFSSTNEAILELGEIQLKELFNISKLFRFKFKNAIKSHRNSDVVGQRVIVHMIKTEL